MLNTIVDIRVLYSSRLIAAACTLSSRSEAPGPEPSALSSFFLVFSVLLAEPDKALPTGPRAPITLRPSLVKTLFFFGFPCLLSEPRANISW